MTPAGEIEQITREIHTLEAHATERAGSAIEFKVQIGKRLIRAKELLPHGRFLRWAAAEFQWSRMHVARHMQIATKVTRGLLLPPEASLRAALAAIAEADREAKPEASGAEEQAAATRYTLSLVWPGGEAIELPVRAALAERLMGRELTAATVTLVAA